MLTEQEIEKFANWAIAQEAKLFDAKHPKCENSESLTDSQLLEALGVEYFREAVRIE